MAEKSDGFLALPGGVGTFEELFEVITWAVLGLHQKPVGLLNVQGYFDPLLAMLHHAVSERFCAPNTSICWSSPTILKTSRPGSSAASISWSRAAVDRVDQT